MKKKLLVLFLAMSMVLTFAACGGGGGEETAKDTMTIVSDEWYGTDMFQNDAWATAQGLVADTLLTIDPETGELTDGICTDFKASKDGKTITMTVPEGKKYATGEQVEPEDVVASLEWGKEVSPYADGYANIESMEVDGRNVILHLSEYSAAMLYNFTDCFIGVIDKDQLDTLSKDELMWGAVPYGQYQVVDYVSGSEVTLAPNEGYVTDNPYVENKGVGKLKEIKVKFSGEEFTELEELKAGDLDFTFNLSLDGKAELEGVENVSVVERTYPNIGYFELNTQKGIFKDKDIRKAVALAIDREALCELTNGATTPAYSMVFDTVLNFSQEAKDYFKDNYANDPEQAKQILADKGYKDTDNDGYLDKDGKALEFTYYTRPSGTSLTIGQGLQAQMKEFGIKMNIESIDWNYIYEKIADGDYDAGIEKLGWAEPNLVMNACYYDSKAPGNNDEIKAMVKKADETIDADARTKAYGDAQIALFDYLDIIPFYSDNSYIAHSADLKDLVILSNSTMYFNDMHF